MAQIKEAPAGAFCAIVSDIMMGGIDGFAFRDMVRGIDPVMPFFFLTALDPEEGSGFLKRIVEDPISYYLPKSASTDVLVNRVKRVAASRRIELFIDRQMEDSRLAKTLAAHIQRSMLPPRSYMGDESFYATWWRPLDVVSGDMYEVVPLGGGRWLYVLGDIQGHGASAALAMTAVQAFMKQLASLADVEKSTGPDVIANLLQGFFRDNMTDVSYMTALICIHDPAKAEVKWISCGAPDPVISDFDNPGLPDTSAGRKGGLPIGLVEGTVYTADDVVTWHMTPSSVIVAITDGLFDLSRDKEGFEKIPVEVLRDMRHELILEGRRRGAIAVAAHKYMKACEDLGYDKYQDDASVLIFGQRLFLKGVYEASVLLTPTSIDEAAVKMSDWCRAQGWDETGIGLVQLVLEEKLMNIYDHGFDDRMRLKEVANLRLVKRSDGRAELTVWDCGTPEPSIEVAGGDAATAFQLKNKEMSNHGRGRLMIREICSGVARSRCGILNETIYHIPMDAKER